MKRSNRLGKGLDALMASEDSEERLQEVEVNKIEPNPYQPRIDFDQNQLEDLASSIKRHGLLQPVIVRKKELKFQLAVGERRWRAAKIANLKQIPAIVQKMGEEDMMEIALIENLQREDLNPMEEAQAYQSLMDNFNLTQEELSTRIGKSRSAVANMLRLLRLSPLVQQHVSRETISKGHARALLALKDFSLQERILTKIVERELSVRETERLVKELQHPPEKEKEKEKKASPYQNYERFFRDILETEVKISESKRARKIVIKFDNEKDLKRILNRIKG